MQEIESLKTPESEGYVYVRERAALETLIERVDRAERVALDTEADSLHNYFEKVCLVQLSLGGEHYVVDPLAGLDLGGFLEALAEEPLIVHGGDYDLRMMRASLGFTPRRDVFDTMIAAQLLGIEQIGLAALIERCFKITLGKEGQKSDWSRRPLSEKQLRYAVNDTRFLEPLADRLRGELSERGRVDWHRESCRAMVESSRRDHARDPEDAWRIKGAGRLTRRQLAYLRELWCWRDQHARGANLPPFKVFGNQQILELLQWAESHPSVPLHQGPRLPRNIVGARLRTLEEAITRAAGMDQTQWPEVKRRDRDAARNGCSGQINALRAECARIAKELGIAASTLAPRAALEAIVRSRPRTLDAMMENGRLLRWQAERVQGAVEKCLHSTQEESRSRR
ncbi:MAG: HRDC domain-containing protein [Deltaproteobacteria bacterium]|nr:HRDC domain-containing protein [Deltaproteobacteria bacterium]